MSLPVAIPRRRLLRLLGGTWAISACAAARAEEKPAPPPADGARRTVFLDIDRIVVSVFRGDNIDRHEMLLMKLELADDTGIARIQETMPRLRDAFIRAWNTIGARPDAAARGLDVAAGRQRMIAACDQIAGPGLVRNVLIVAQSSRVVQPVRR